MKGTDTYLKQIQEKVPFLKNETFEITPEGTHHTVFVSENYVIRFRDKNPEILKSEAEFLETISHPLIPQNLYLFDNDTLALVENRLPGKPLNTMWRNISTENQTNIITHVVDFLKDLRKQNRDFVYSVHTNKKYPDFFNYLTDELANKITNIRKYAGTETILEEILLITDNDENRGLFTNTANVPVHGDLIIHNLLTDGVNLTGVIDWELALYGDPDYDLCRLLYYRECAKAYCDQGVDDTFEYDYMEKLINTLFSSDLVSNKENLLKKYEFMRSVFFVNSLYWASNSNKPNENITEIVTLWNNRY